MLNDCCEDCCDGGILGSLLTAFRLLLEDVTKGCRPDAESDLRWK